jgi:diguanylate cyclase (GGDEF)-like protein
MRDDLRLLEPIAEALDSLGLAACVFDAEDRALLWNRSFLAFFPEHAQHIHVGEPYRANLRRFYAARIDPAELPMLESFVDQGVARHRSQQRPFTFEHHGRRLHVASLPLPGVGRIRIWMAEPAAAHGAAPERGTAVAAAAALAFDAASSALLDHVPDAVMVADGDERIVWVNEPFVAMYRLRDRDAALGASLEDVYRAAWHGAEAADAPRFEAGLALLTQGVRYAGAPFEVPLPEARWSRVVAQRRADGRIFFAHVDITELKRQHEQLLQAERRARESQAALAAKSALLEATLERMEQGIMMVNAQRVVEVCNRRAIELLNLPRALIESRPTFEQVLAYQWSTDEFAHTPADLQEFIRAGGILDRPHCYDRRRPDGRVIEVHSVPIEGGGVLRTYTDISERKRAEERIRHVARHDGLTSLVNRDVFLEHLAGAAQSGAAGFAVHYVDLDGFKPVNDRFGHAAGDKVLAQLAARMRRTARDADVVARMGGDEFAILQLGVERADAALGLARRVLEALREPVEADSQPLQVGASIGIALFPAAGADPDTLLRHADAAMYAAKAAGRNCVRLYEPSP